MKRKNNRARVSKTLLVVATACIALAVFFLYSALNNERDGGELAEKNAQALLASAQASGDILALQNVEGYSIIGKLSVDKLELELPIIGETTSEALDVSVCLYNGPSTPEAEGNIVITGHNYKNGSHFGRLKKLEIGDAVQLMDKWGNEYSYEVYDLETTTPDKIEKLDEYEGERALTLVTCTSSGNKRLIVRCKMV